ERLELTAPSNPAIQSRDAPRERNHQGVVGYHGDDARTGCDEPIEVLNAGRVIELNNLVNRAGGSLARRRYPCLSVRGEGPGFEVYCLPEYGACRQQGQFHQTPEHGPSIGKRGRRL